MRLRDRPLRNRISGGCAPAIAARASRRGQPRWPQRARRDVSLSGRTEAAEARAPSVVQPDGGQALHRGGQALAEVAEKKGRHRLARALPKLLAELGVQCILGRSGSGSSGGGVQASLGLPDAAAVALAVAQARGGQPRLAVLNHGIRARQRHRCQGRGICRTRTPPPTHNVSAEQETGQYPARIRSKPPDHDRAVDPALYLRRV